MAGIEKSVAMPALIAKNPNKKSLNVLKGASASARIERYFESSTLHTREKRVTQGTLGPWTIFRLADLCRTVP